MIASRETMGTDTFSAAIGCLAASDDRRVAGSAAENVSVPYAWLATLGRVRVGIIGISRSYGCGSNAARMMYCKSCG